jgi:hypothetical protein
MILKINAARNKKTPPFRSTRNNMGRAAIADMVRLSI